MSEDEPLTAAIESLGVDFPSLVVVRTTFGTLDRSITTVRNDCQEISGTLKVLGDAMQMITQRSGTQQDWGGFGLVGLPIMGAMRAVKGAASQYVKQQTGVPLSSWADFVVATMDRFESYVSQLDAVSAISQRHRDAAEETPSPVAREDLEALSAVQWETTAWKAVVGRVAQLAQVVEAVLEADLGGDPGSAEAGRVETTSAFTSSLQKRLKEVQSRTIDKSSDLRAWVLQPFLEVRDAVTRLPSQVESLSREVALLEVLLDLQIAQIRALLGGISPTEVKIIGLRVAACVVLPELARDLSEARRRTSAYEAYLDRLVAAHEAGVIAERPHAVLSREYEEALASSRARLAALDEQADVWRRGGHAVLDAAAEWIRIELDVLEARRVTEESERISDRGVPLQRELQRLDEARSLMASL